MFRASLPSVENTTMANFSRMYKYAHLLLVLCQFSYSGWHIIASIVLKNGADPLVFAAYRELISSVVMFIFVKFQGHQVHIHKSDMLRFAFLGFCSFVNVVGVMLALQYISATRFAIFQPSIPCIATVVSILVGLEKMTFIKLIGIAFAVGGAVLVEVWNPSASSSDETNVFLGTIILIGQCCGQACLIVFQKSILSKYPPAVVTFVYYSIGSIYTLLFCAGWWTRFTLSSLYFKDLWLPWLGIGYVVLFPTVFACNAISWAGRMLTPSMTTLYCTLQPVGTILLTFIIYKTIVTISEGLGALLVIAGLVITVAGQTYAKETSKSRRSSLEDDFFYAEDEILGNNPTHRSRPTSERPQIQNDALLNYYAKLPDEEDESYENFNTLHSPMSITNQNRPYSVPSTVGLIPSDGYVPLARVIASPTAPYSSF